MTNDNGTVYRIKIKRGDISYNMARYGIPDSLVDETNSDLSASKKKQAEMRGNCTKVIVDVSTKVSVYFEFLENR